MLPIVIHINFIILLELLHSHPVRISMKRNIKYTHIFICMMYRPRGRGTNTYLHVLVCSQIIL